MVNKKSRALVREKKHRRMRNHLSGTAERPRLAVFRSNNHMLKLLTIQLEILWLQLPHLTKM